MKVTIKNEAIMRAALAQLAVAHEFALALEAVLTTMEVIFKSMLERGEVSDTVAEIFVSEFESLQQYDPSMLGPTLAQAGKVISETLE